MKYITGMTNYEHNVGGVLFPKRHYEQWELDRGRNTILQLEDDILENLLKNYPVLKELFDDGRLLASDELPLGKVQDAQSLVAHAHQAEAAKRRAEAELESYKESAEAEIKRLQEMVAQVAGTGISAA